MIDITTGADVGIGIEHNMVHDGESYSVSFSNAVTNQNEQSVIAFRTPATGPKIHLLISASATALTTLSLVEAPSIDNGEGTQAVARNRNRSSSNTSSVRSIEAAETVGSITTFNETQAAGANITESTIIYSEQFGASGNPQSKSGGGKRDEFERVLAPDTEYAIILNADDDNTNQHAISLSWYEYTDKRMEEHFNVE